MYISPFLPSVLNLHHLATGLLPNLSLYVHSFPLLVHSLEATEMVIISTNFPEAISWLPIKVRENKFNSWTSEILHILPPSTSPTPFHVTFPLLPRWQPLWLPFMLLVPKYFFFRPFHFLFSLSMMFLCSFSWHG